MKRGLLLVVAPLIGVALLVAAFALRPGASRLQRKGATPTASPIEAPVAGVPPAPKLPGKPAPPEQVAKKSEEVRVRSTFANYRTAVATGNTRMADALYPVLLKDRAAAVQCAEEELAKAKSDFDREVAQKTLDAFRR